MVARQRVLITLPIEAYRRLADLAHQDERAIDQQASYLLKELLTPSAEPGTQRSQGTAACGSHI